MLLIPQGLRVCVPIADIRAINQSRRTSDQATPGPPSAPSHPALCHAINLCGASLKMTILWRVGRKTPKQGSAYRRSPGQFHASLRDCSGILFTICRAKMGIKASRRAVFRNLRSISGTPRRLEPRETQAIFGGIAPNRRSIQRTPVRIVFAPAIYHKRVL